MGKHGAGSVVRNIVVLTIIRQRVKSFLRQRTIMAIAVRPRQGSSKKTTVLEGTTLIALSAGESRTQ